MEGGIDRSKENPSHPTASAVVDTQAPPMTESYQRETSASP